MAELPEGKPLTSDEQLLEKKRRNMTFNIERIARYAVLVAGMILGLALLIVVIFMLWTEQKWRDYALQAVFNSLPAIVVAFFVVVGIKNYGQKT